MSIEFRPIGWTMCELTKECKNNACIFKLASCYGFPIFWYPGNDIDGEESCFDKQKRILKELNLDRVIYPEFTANIGTNIIYVNCEDKKWEN